MTKYEKLGPFLDQQKTLEVPMTFAEIERVIGHTLPRSARYPAWWSNNPSNNVMTQVWLDAGFKTEQVNIEGRRLVFRRVGKTAPGSGVSSSHSSPGMADSARSYVAANKPESAQPNNEKMAHSIHPAFGSMKGLITVEPGVDLTEPSADPKSWKFRW